jgi:hypothetical protein
LTASVGAGWAAGAFAAGAAVWAAVSATVVEADAGGFADLADAVFELAWDFAFAGLAPDFFLAASGGDVSSADGVNWSLNWRPADAWPNSRGASCARADVATAATPNATAQAMAPPE